MAKNDNKNSPSTAADMEGKSILPASGKAPQDTAKDSATEQVIALFGGLRPMASKLGIAVSTIQGWKARHHIPENRHAEIQAAAEKHNIQLEKSLLLASSTAADSEDAKDAAMENDKKSNKEDNQKDSKEDSGSNSSGSSKPSAAADKAAKESAETADTADKTDPAPAAPSKKTTPPAPAASGGFGISLMAGLLSSAVIIAGLGGAAYLTKERWQAQLASELGLVPATEVQALADRLTALESDADKSADPELAAALAEVKSQLAQLEEAEKAQEARIAALKQGPQNPTGAASSSASPSAPSAATSQAAGDLAAQLSALESRVDQKLAALPKQNAEEMAAERARIKGLQAKMDLLDEELTTVQKLLTRNESQLDSTSDQLAVLRDTAGAVADLRQRLNASEKRLKTVENTALAASSQRATDAALALAVGQLREALRYSGSYSQDLVGLQQLAKGNADLEAPLRVLERSAKQGLPSLRQLKDEFGPVAQAIAATEVSSAAGTDWSQTVLKNLQDIVVVRPVGNVTGDSATAIAARAEVRLGDGDLAGAVSELSTLPEAARAPASDWLKAAQQRLDAEAALDQLSRLSINRLAPNQPVSNDPADGAASSSTEG
ncbi:carph-isopro domain-containing protein [Rhodovibrionaceae bacterium A322]